MTACSVPYTILMSQKLQLRGWDSRHWVALFNQGLETVVHSCDLVLQLLIHWKPEQLADNDDAWVGNCSYHIIAYIRIKQCNF